jgi:hypothetical protein
VTVGIPGTGISYTTASSSPTRQAPAENPQPVEGAEPPRARATRAWLLLLVLLAIAGFVGWLVGVGMR